MGNYLNPGMENFQKMVNSEIYVDKTGLIRYTNSVINTMQGYLGVSRPRPFVLIIDEWDCIFREYQDMIRLAQEIYLDFLRDLLKDKEYIYLAYMTGILPIKKYGTHSALNMFDEFSMIDPGPLAEYVGFTEKEVRSTLPEVSDGY